MDSDEAKEMRAACAVGALTSSKSTTSTSSVGACARQGALERALFEERAPDRAPHVLLGALRPAQAFVVANLVEAVAVRDAQAQVGTRRSRVRDGARSPPWRSALPGLRARELRRVPARVDRRAAREERAPEATTSSAVDQPERCGAPHARRRRARVMARRPRARPLRSMSGWRSSSSASSRKAAAASRMSPSVSSRSRVAPATFLPRLAEGRDRALRRGEQDRGPRRGSRAACQVVGGHVERGERRSGVLGDLLRDRGPSRSDRRPAARRRPARSRAPRCSPRSPRSRSATRRPTPSTTAERVVDEHGDAVHRLGRASLRAPSSGSSPPGCSAPSAGTAAPAEGWPSDRRSRRRRTCCPSVRASPAARADRSEAPERHASS